LQEYGNDMTHGSRPLDGPRRINDWPRIRWHARRGCQLAPRL
jgi:hypothetical protein